MKTRKDAKHTKVTNGKLYERNICIDAESMPFQLTVLITSIFAYYQHKRIICFGILPCVLYKFSDVYRMLRPIDLLAFGPRDASRSSN